MLSVALVFGLIAAVLAKIWLDQQAGQPDVVIQRPNEEMGRVVVADKPLRFGMKVSSSMLREVDWPMSGIPAGAYRSKSAMFTDGGKRVVLAAIAANEPILKAKITGPGQRATLSALVAEGMNAVSVRVNDVLGVAGFILPGERVDILLTQTPRNELKQGGGAKETGAHTDLLLQNVRVLAVDQLADDRSEKPTLVKTVTIEVDTEQAQKLALATAVGQLSLALRSAGSTSPNRARRITTTDLRSDLSLSRRVAKLAGPSANGSSVNITVTRAVEREDYSVVRESR
jgi:pilus assembly protein CpaB